MFFLNISPGASQSFAQTFCAMLYPEVSPDPLPKRFTLNFRHIFRPKACANLRQAPDNDERTYIMLIENNDGILTIYIYEIFSWEKTYDDLKFYFSGRFSIFFSVVFCVFSVMVYKIIYPMSFPKFCFTFECWMTKSRFLHRWCRIRIRMR